MSILRALLIVMLITLLGYTAVAISNDGFNFPMIAINGVLAMGWTGQFHLDFVCYLVLSALWVGWRHEYSGAGIALALLASVGGILFLSVYLLVVSRSADSLEQLLLGNRQR